jgi:sugar lactone lactonase YvrE
MTALLAGCSGGGLTASPGPTPQPSPSAVPTTLPTAKPTEAEVHYGLEVLVPAPGGRVYGTDCQAARVVVVDSAGIREIAGSGPGGFAAGFAGDGGPATAAEMQCPIGLALAADGTLFVVDHANNRIRAIDPRGIIRTVAGTGPEGINTGTFGGDGGPAVAAQLQEPTFLILDGAGNIYFSDRDNDRVRRIDADGTITTVAGTGQGGFSGDGGPATKAALNGPAGLAIDAHGNLFIADANNNRIRVVDRNGRIRTIAGTGQIGSDGDGGPARTATLADPEGLALAPDGSLYVATPAGNNVRKVTPDGTITTVAGVGTIGLFGDGGPAASAGLGLDGSAAGIALDGTGNLYIPDTSNLAIRIVSPDGIIRTFSRT